MKRVRDWKTEEKTRDKKVLDRERDKTVEERKETVEGKRQGRRKR